MKSMCQSAQKIRPRLYYDNAFDPIAGDSPE